MRRKIVIPIGLGIVVLLAVLLPLIGNGYYVYLFALVFTNVVLASSLRPSLICGQLNIGHSGFMSIGAYASALLAKDLGMPFETKTSQYYLVLCLMLAILAVLWKLESSRLGLIWKSIGMADNLAQSLGVNIAKHKLLAFTLGCFFAGVAGAFYAHFIRFLFPPEFGFLMATNILVYNFVGGRGHFVGPIVGAIFLSLLSEPFRGSPYETIFFSIAMLLTILFLPGGLN